MQENEYFTIDMAGRAWGQIINLPLPYDIAPGKYSLHISGLVNNASPLKNSGRVCTTFPGGTSCEQYVCIRGGNSSAAFQAIAVVDITPGCATHATLQLDGDIGGNLSLLNISYLGVRIAQQTTQTKKCQCTSSELFTKGCQCNGE